jgi:hypothetical protein
MVKKTAPKRHPLPFLILILLLLTVVTGAIIIKQKKAHTTAMMTSQSVSPETALLVDAALWYPSAPWSTPSAETQTTQYGTLQGEGIRATVPSSTASITHFEMPQALAAKGYLPDTSLAADGPGSSVWGYKKTNGDKTSLLLFSYQTAPTSSNQNEPLQFNCPCMIEITVFASNPFSQK